MKNEDHAWRELQRIAAARLRPDFSERVLRAAQGPTEAAWRQMHAHGASQLRPGFAERVLRAARALRPGPSLIDQFILGAVTAAVCLLGSVYIHERTTEREEVRNIARWHQLAAELQEMDNVR